MNPLKLTGLIAAPFTPFHADGTLHLGRIEQQAASLAAHSVRSVFVCGTTGECASLTLSERMAVATRWCEVAGSHLQVLVHVGHTCIHDSMTLAAHAQQIRAAGVGCFSPFFFKPSHPAPLVESCAAIAHAAPELPFFYYHIPSMTGVPLPAADFLRAAAERIPNLAGVKFTHENLMDYAECLRVDPSRFDALFGRDEILLAGLALGAKGAIGSTYNFAAPLFHRLIQCFQNGDLESAQSAQAKANEMISLMLHHGGLPAGKAIMRMIGIDCGPVRLPLCRLSTEQENALRTQLQQIGFFEFHSALSASSALPA